MKTRKIFVGGLPHDITLETFKEYFLSYGDIEDIVIMLDRHTNKPRGFGFVTFENEYSVDEVMSIHEEHNILGQWVDCKRAIPGNPSHHPPDMKRKPARQSRTSVSDKEQYIQKDLSQEEEEESK